MFKLSSKPANDKNVVKDADGEIKPNDSVPKKTKVKSFTDRKSDTPKSKEKSESEGEGVSEPKKRRFTLRKFVRGGHDKEASNTPATVAADAIPISSGNPPIIEVSAPSEIISGAPEIEESHQNNPELKIEPPSETASRQALPEATESLQIHPDEQLVDGNWLPPSLVKPAISQEASVVSSTNSKVLGSTVGVYQGQHDSSNSENQSHNSQDGSLLKQIGKSTNSSYHQSQKTSGKLDTLKAEDSFTGSLLPRSRNGSNQNMTQEQAAKMAQFSKSAKSSFYNGKIANEDNSAGQHHDSLVPHTRDNSMQVKTRIFEQQNKYQTEFINELQEKTNVLEVELMKLMKSQQNISSSNTKSQQNINSNSTKEPCTYY